MFALEVILDLVMPVDIQAAVANQSSNVLHRRPCNRWGTEHEVHVFIRPILLLVLGAQLVAGVDFDKPIKSLNSLFSEQFSSPHYRLALGELPGPNARHEVVLVGQQVSCVDNIACADRIIFLMVHELQLRERFGEVLHHR